MITNDDTCVTSQMLEIPNTHYRFLDGRNWLGLQPEREDGYWANWFVEGEEHPFTKVVHPVDFEMESAKMPAETIIRSSSASEDVSPVSDG